MLISHQKLTVRTSDLIRARLTTRMVHDYAYLAGFVYENDKADPGSAIWTSSGRAALKHILLNEKDIKNVALPAFTCHVVKDAIERAGKKVVYFDTAELPTLDEIRSAIEDKKARIDALVLPYNFGFMPNMEKILDICKKNDILLIEDCAQALGAKFAGKKAGSFGDYAAYSFGISKNIGFIGGMIRNNTKYNISYDALKNSESFSKSLLAKLDLKALVSKPFFSRYFYSLTYKLLQNELKAEHDDLDYKLPKYCKAVVLEIAKRYDKTLAIRRENAALCMEELDGLVDFIRPIKDSKAAWLYFVLLSKNREQLRKSLLKEKVDVQPLMTFGNLSSNKKFTKAENMQNSHLIFALYRSREETEYIIKKIKKVCR